MVRFSVNASKDISCRRNRTTLKLLSVLHVARNMIIVMNVMDRSVLRVQMDLLQMIQENVHLHAVSLVALNVRVLQFAKLVRKTASSNLTGTVGANAETLTF